LIIFIITRKGNFDMKRYLISAFIFAFTLMANMAFADGQSQQEIQLTENGIVSTNASGDPQTTVIDANGNLKMIPASPSVKNNAPTLTPGMLPDASSTSPAGQAPWPAKGGGQGAQSNMPASPHAPVKPAPKPNAQNPGVAPQPLVGQ
jgi:hypothetical protein